MLRYQIMRINAIGLRKTQHNIALKLLYCVAQLEKKLHNKLLCFLDLFFLFPEKAEALFFF